MGGGGWLRGWLLTCGLMLLLSTPGWARQAAGGTAAPEASAAGRPASSLPAAAGTASQAHGELLLSLPFTNSGANGSLDWVGAAFPELMNQRFTAAGFLPISRKDRLYALDHLGLPPEFVETRASMLRLGQTLDADSVIFGTYEVVGTEIRATARVLNMVNLRESGPLTESAALSRLPDMVNALAWRVARQLDPQFTGSEATFLAADAGLRLDAFENYIRALGQGGSQASPEDRVHHLRDAVRLDPKYAPAWLALGDAEFAAQDYEAAAAAYGHLTRNDPNALQADFYRGLAFFYTGKYLPAEDAFAFVSTRLPLPEVVNNQGVAAARRGRDGTPLFQQAITGDPKDPDFHINFALACARKSDGAGAQKEAAEALRLRPEDPEIAGFAANLRMPGWLAGAVAGGNLPLERIKRSYDEAGFRQAAFEMDQMEALRAAAETPAKRELALLADGERYLNAGLLVQAEREFNRAAGVDPRSAGAYAGLARVRERTGDKDAARELAAKSLLLHENAPAHLVMARLALVGGQVQVASTEVDAALRLDGRNAEALGLQKAVLARGAQ